MNEYIGYIRVSTPRQGEGVSLEVQKDAISSYAERNRHPVGLWLEEKETAGKQGRPVFNRAMKLLRQRKHKGIILHKLDRGARNLKDWADIGELVDQGIEVHFVNESLDLQTRGGRLSADIQAVVAADFIRNQREETKKGLYGRLKQGLYPWGAPIGYKNNGTGKLKTIDPVCGPLVRKAFELYGTAAYNFDTLGEELYRSGLRNKKGTRVTHTGLSTILNSTFYIGIIQIKKTNQTFAGNHEPLISKSLFDRVQKVLTGKFNAKTQRHAFIFRRMLSCSVCGYSLIGERQKGNVYYRCHGNHLPRPSVRENIVERHILKLLQAIHIADEHKKYFKSRILKMKEVWQSQREEEVRGLRLQLNQINDRRDRLTDAYLDQALDKGSFEARKTNLLFDQKGIEEKLGLLTRNDDGPGDLEKFLELAGSALLSYRMGIPEEKREIVKLVTSNRVVSDKSLYLEPSIAFRELANCLKTTPCGPKRGIPRTWNRLLSILAKLKAAGQLPDLSGIFNYRQEDNTEN
jgi:DNA invertase Pin-like site-specific DNA recombinase